jgi:hypothetical protein
MRHTVSTIKHVIGKIKKIINSLDPVKHQSGLQTSLYLYLLSRFKGDDQTYTVRVIIFGGLHRNGFINAV